MGFYWQRLPFANKFFAAHPTIGQPIRLFGNGAGSCDPLSIRSKAENDFLIGKEKLLGKIQTVWRQDH